MRSTQSGKPTSGCSQLGLAQLMSARMTKQLYVGSRGLKQRGQPLCLTRRHDRVTLAASDEDADAGKIGRLLWGAQQVSAAGDGLRQLLSHRDQVGLIAAGPVQQQQNRRRFVRRRNKTMPETQVCWNHYYRPSVSLRWTTGKRLRICSRI